MAYSDDHVDLQRILAGNPLWHRGVIVRKSWALGVFAAFLFVLRTLPVDAQVISQPSPMAVTEMSANQRPTVELGALLQPWMEGWAGFGFTNNFYGGWLGAVAALNETRNVWSDGFVLRGEGILGHYDYSTTNLSSGRANVTFGGGALMLGYRKILGSTMLTGYVGANFEDHDNPDPAADVRGTEWGVKVLGEVYSRLAPSQDFYGQAFFSSAFDTWYALARPGFLVAPNLWIGPEGSLFGNGHGTFGGSCTSNSTGLGSCRYSEGRIGAFVHLVIPNQPVLGDWIISGGYRAPLVSNSSDGYYVQIGLNMQFR